MTIPVLFDRQALIRHRQRVASAPADFLVRHTAQEMMERLDGVMRAFTSCAEIGSCSQAIRDIVRARLAAPTVHLEDKVDETLDLPPASIDLSFSLLGFQFVNDLPGLFSQIRRALRPDGLMIAALAGGRTLTELREAFAQAELDIEGGISPRVAPLADVRTMGALLQRAGFALPVADSEVLVVRYDNAFALMADLRAMAATNILVQRRKKFTRRATLMRMADIYRERFSDPDGRIRATFEIIWLSGWAPHENQQKPLRPGSARVSMAEALGTFEHKA